MIFLWGAWLNKRLYSYLFVCLFYFWQYVSFDLFAKLEARLEFKSLLSVKNQTKEWRASDNSLCVIKKNYLYLLIRPKKDERVEIHSCIKCHLVVQIISHIELSASCVGFILANDSSISGYIVHIILVVHAKWAEKKYKLTQMHWHLLRWI